MFPIQGCAFGTGRSSVPLTLGQALDLFPNKAHLDRPRVSRPLSGRLRCRCYQQVCARCYHGLYLPAVPNQKGSSTSCQPFHALKAACPGCAATAVLIWDTPHAGTRMLSDRSFPRPLLPLTPLLRLTVATQASTDAPRSRARHLKKFASAGAVMRPKRELPGHFEISQAQRALVVLSQAARILRDRSSRRSGLERSSWRA